MLQSTSGNVSELTARLLKLIKDEEYSDSDRMGQSPIVSLAREIRELPFLSAERQAVECAVANLPIADEIIESQDLRNTIYLIRAAKIRLESIQTTFLRVLRNHNVPVAKRAEIMRLLAVMKYNFTPMFLEGEVEILQSHPWIWIDCMVRVNWELAAKAITEELIRHQDTEPVLIRLPYWWRRKGQDLIPDLQDWLNVLEPDRRVPIYRWLSAFRIQISDKTGKRLASFIREKIQLEQSLVVQL